LLIDPCPSAARRSRSQSGEGATFTPRSTRAVNRPHRSALSTSTRAAAEAFSAVSFSFGCTAFNGNR